MNDWPTHEFIRVIKGYRKYYGPIDPVYAFRDPDGAYLLLTDGVDEGYLIRERGDRIYDWEDLVPVPADDLKRLRSEFRGAPLSERRLSALLQVTSHLPSTPTSPLDKAVCMVEEALSGSILFDTSSEEYLAHLLGTLSDFQGLGHGPTTPEKGRVLSRIVRLCVEWIAEVSSEGSQLGGLDALEVLSEVRARVESDPAVGGFPAMVALAGDSATLVDEAKDSEEGRRRLAEGLAEPVLTLGRYALVLLAKSLDGSE
jgi:hypothetical protein